MKTSATPRTVFVAVMVAALVAGLLPAGLPEAAAAPLPSTVTLYGNASALNDIVFSEDAAWAVNYVGLIRWDREGEYQTEVPSVETPSGAPVELDPWEVRTDGAVVSNVRLTSLIVDGEGRLWSVGDQLALLDDEGRTVTSYRGDDAWWLGQHYEALVNSVYTNPRVMAVDHTTGWLWMYHPRVRVAAFDGLRLHTWRTETFRPENTLFASPEGEVWVAGPEVAYRYIKDEDSWREYHYAEDMGLPAYDWGQRIFSFDSDLQGRVWVRTSAGAARFDPATETWEAFGPDQGVVGSTYADIRVDPEGNVWTLSGWNLEQNLAILDEAEGMFVPAAPLPRYFVEPDAVQEEPSVAQVRTIRGMRMDLDGRLWILTEIGALHWNGERWQALRVAGPSMPAWSPAFAVANAPELADDPILFMGGSSKVRLADDAETWPIFSENPFSFRDVPGLSFGTVGADGKVYALRGRADLWTFNEGDIADQPENDWVPLAPARVSGNPNHPIAFSFMNDLAVDAEGTAWLASTMGLWRWRNDEWFLYEQRDGIPVHARSRLIGTVIDQLELDEDGNIWFITAPYMLQFDNYGGFLVKFDGETFETVADLPIRYLGNTGEPMRYDPVTGLIWLRDRKDLRAYDTATGAWQVADLSPLGPDVTLRDMAPTGDGGVWVVTEAGALFRYQEGAFERLTLPEANPVAGRVGADPAGNTWVTGLSGTVSMWDGAEWTIFTAEDQLMGGRHRDLIFRDDEVFLLGQFSVDYRKGAGDWTPLRPTQPLPNAPLSPLSAMVDSEGVLWYVDRRGVARYVDGAWDIVLVFEQDLRGGGLYDIVNLPDGPLWMSNRAVLGSSTRWTGRSSATARPRRCSASALQSSGKTWRWAAWMTACSSGPASSRSTCACTTLTSPTGCASPRRRN
ncbi:MAG: hypothetical protein M5R40_25870 [Anaerolineae bacterium]|nr:hypothetical protein [Anaerolineae bacterium]